MKQGILVLIMIGIGLMDKQKQEKAEIVIRGGTIVTMDAGRRLVEDGFIAIREGEIVAVGTRSELDGTYSTDNIIDATGKLVIPGLINGHTHVPMTLFRGMADDLALHRWLHEHIFPAESKHVNEAFVRAGTRLALAEMVRGGTTTFCDMYYYEDAIAEETTRAGLRAVLAQTILDFPSPDYKKTDDALAETGRFISRWQGHPLIVPAIGPHAPYTVSPENLSKVLKLSDRTGAPVVIHVSETDAEVRDISGRYGAPPVEHLARLGILNERTIMAHVVHIHEEELMLIKQAQSGVVHNPESNMKLASGIAPVPQMLKQGIPVGLGTDGAASNNDLSMWGETDMAAKLHKVNTGDPEAVSAMQAFEMATIGGARALHLDHLTGSLEVGKRADISIVDKDGLHQIPMYNVYSGLVYTTKASDVRTVLVNGRLLMKDRQLLTLDEKAIREEVEVYRRRILEE
jgi:5-methylthioadenosine/S-adenosylhomocysteine deaminase